MRNQVSNPTILPALLIAGVSSVLVSLAIAHGLLRTFMHARGVKPWTIGDTLGSTLLVSLSAALIGIGSMLIALMATNVVPLATLYVFGVVVLLVLGALFLRLGLLALRKLT